MSQPFLVDIYVVVGILETGGKGCFRIELCILGRLARNLENTDQSWSPAVCIWITR